MSDESDGRSKGQLTADKFRWLQQVAGDPKLSSTAVACAIFMASKFWNSQTGEIYPAATTLAELIGRGLTQTRAGTNALVARGHIEMVSAGGGAHRTNRYKPVLKPIGFPIGNEERKHIGFPIGSNSENVSESRVKHIGNPTGKHIGNPIPTPLKDSFDESPSSGRAASPPLSGGQRLLASTESTNKQPRRRTLNSAPPLGVGDEFDHDELGSLEVTKVTRKYIVASQKYEPFEQYRLDVDAMNFASAAYQLDAMA